MTDASSKKLDPNRSLVNKCLVRLQQQQQNQALPNVERLAEAFRIYDELCEHLGVFKEAFRLLESEVYECVYSAEHMTAASGETADKGAIKRVPYFVLHHKLLTERDTRRDELQAQIDALNSVLNEKETFIKSLQDKVKALDGEVKEKMAIVSALNSSIKQRDVEIANLQETIRHEQQTAEQNRKDYEDNLFDLNEELKYTKQDRDEIAKYKINYENLNYTFQIQVDESVESRQRKIRPMIATKESYLQNDILHARKIEEQLLTVQNLMIEENEQFMENYEKQLARFITDLPETDYRYSLQQMEIQKLNQDAAVTKDRYLESLSQIEAELRYVRRHATMLQEQLQQLEDERKKNAQAMTAAQRKSVQFDASGPSIDSGNLSVNPFTINERVLSKYACVVSFSLDHGKSYYDLDLTGYCRSCSEKTTLCPHRVILAETVVPLQTGTTHLKFIRPVVTINQQLVDQLVGLPTMKGAQVQFLEDAKDKEHGYTTMSLQNTQKLVIGASQAAPEDLTMDQFNEASIVKLKKTSLVRLMEDYQVRTATDRYIPMRLALPRLMSVVESFLAAMLLDDDSEDYQPLPILDHFYHFMMERFLDRHVSYLATFDFISSLLELAKNNQYCTLLAHVFVGNQDGAVLRYLTIIADLVQRVQWTVTYDARLFFQLIYPFLGDEELDALLLSYTGFAENKISARLVYEFILFTILKERESRFVEMQSLLLQYLDALSKSRLKKHGGATTESTFTTDVEEDGAGRHIMLGVFSDYVDMAPGANVFVHLAKQMFSESEIALMAANHPHSHASAILTFMKSTSTAQPFEYPLTATQFDQHAAASHIHQTSNLSDPQFARMNTRESLGAGAGAGAKAPNDRAPQHAATAAHNADDRAKPTGIAVWQASQILGYITLLSAFDELRIDTNEKIDKLRKTDDSVTVHSASQKPQRSSASRSKRTSALSTRSGTQSSEFWQDEASQGNQEALTLIPHSRIIHLGRNMILAKSMREVAEAEANSEYDT